MQRNGAAGRVASSKLKDSERLPDERARLLPRGFILFRVFCLSACLSMRVKSMTDATRTVIKSLLLRVILGSIG